YGKAGATVKVWELQIPGSNPSEARWCSRRYKAAGAKPRWLEFNCRWLRGLVGPAVTKWHVRLRFLGNKKT
ncbi:unnamed protein product, partial [Linum tenue]